MMQSNAAKSNDVLNAAERLGFCVGRPLITHQPVMRSVAARGQDRTALRSASQARRRGGHPGFRPRARRFPRAAVHFARLPSFEKIETPSNARKGGGRA